MLYSSVSIVNFEHVNADWLPKTKYILSNKPGR